MIADLSASGVRKVVVSADPYKIDDRQPDRVSNPNLIHVEWLGALFADLLADLFGATRDLVTGEEPGSPTNRMNFYRHLGLPFSTASWAAIYDDFQDDGLAETLAERFADSFVLSIELPPYLEMILNRHNIPFVDLGIHPVRFLPDYIFGIRSNVATVSQRIAETSIPVDVFSDFARVSKARTARVMRGWRPEVGSALFLGQLDVDSSLIFEGRMASLDTIEDMLLSLTMEFPKVYYKKHPHLKDFGGVSKIISKLSNCEVAEVNIYDALARDEFFLVASLSSGALHEGQYFGASTRRMLPTSDRYEIAGLPTDEAIARGRYFAAPPDIFRRPYWQYILFGEGDFTPRVPDSTEGALKFTLNQKWGR